MAITFTVETGAVVSGANSYVSVSDATDIIDVNIHQSTAWNALSTTQQEYLLIWATRSLDAYVDWEGTKTDADSALRWPRTGVTDRDGNAVGINEIPEQLKQATALLASSLRATDRSGEQGRDGVRRVKADVVEIELDENYRIGMLTDDLAFLLKGLGIVNTGSSLGFGQIVRS